MGRGVEKLLRGILAAGSLWGAEVQAEPRRMTDEQTEMGGKVTHKPEKLDRRNMPALEPKLFKDIAPEKRLAFADAAVEFLAEEIPGAENIATQFSALPPEERGQAAAKVFEVTRLVATLIRNDLIRLVPLNEDQITSLQQLSDQLHFGELGDYDVLRQWTAKLRKQPGGQDKLYIIWHRASELLHGDGLNSSVPSAETAASVRVDISTSTASAKEISPTVEKKELRPQVVSRLSVKEYEGHPTIALTFDDGPHPTNTPRILNILKANSIKATFFVQGKNLVNPELLARIRAEGHEIALHSYDHTNMVNGYADNAEQAFMDQVEKVNQRLEQVTGTGSRLFRPPEGAITPEQTKLFLDKGYWIVRWSKDTEDWNPHRNTTERITSTTEKTAKGDIVLMHDGGGGKGARDNTIAALPGMIQKWQGLGYRFLTVSEGLGLAPITKPAETPTPTPEPTNDAANPKDGNTKKNGDTLLPPTFDPETEATNSAPAPEATREQKKLPPGAFGWDQDGLPFGLNFQGYVFYTEEPNHPDLVPFDGVETDGNVKEMRLRKTTYENFQALCRELEESGPAELKQLGCHVTEAFRTLVDQKKIKAEKKEWAADPGKSPHHKGRAIDLLGGNTVEMYNWLFEPREVLADRDYIPRAVRYGFVLTVMKEGWHLEDVGKEQAAVYWKKNGKKIVAQQSKYLQSLETVLARLASLKN